MTFECRTKNSNEKWTAQIVFLKKSHASLEFIVEGKSIIHCIIGKTYRGRFGCFPDLNVGCHLVDFHNRYWNLEKLISILGEFDGITIENALFMISKSKALVNINSIGLLDSNYNYL